MKNDVRLMVLHGARWLRATMVAFGALGMVGVSQGADHRFSLLLDTDNNAATGCAVSALFSGLSGTTGIERIATVTVSTTTTAVNVTRVELQTCSAGLLGAATVIDSGTWSAGMGNGTAGSAAIEFSIPRNLLPASGTMRAYAASSSAANAQDVTSAFQIALPAAPIADPVQAVPLSRGLVLLIAALLAIGSAVWLRKHPALRSLAFVMFSAGLSAAVWAASIIKDGNVSDWTGVSPSVTDPAGDAPVNADLLAVYTQTDPTNLNVRIDANVQRETVAPTNVAPTVSAGANQTITLPATASLVGTASDDGLPNPPGTVTTSWSTVSGPGTVTFANAASRTTTASFSVAGTYVLRLTASDSVLSANSTVAITVNAVVAGNQPPTVNAGAAQSITLPNTATLAGTASDDGLPSPATLTTTWTLQSGPTQNAAISDVKALAPTVTFAAPGVYVFELAATDGALTTKSTVQITVADNAPKLAAIADRTIPAGTLFRQVIAANDGNAKDTLNFSLPTAPSGATLNPHPVLNWTPSISQLGVHNFTARVVDTNGNADTTNFKITVVAPSNRAPVLTNQANASIGQGASFTRTLAATDPDGDLITYALVNPPSGMTIAGANVSWPTGTSAPGVYSVTVKATDPAGLFDAKRFTVTINAAAAPVANDDTYSVQIGQTLTVSASQGVLTNDVDLGGATLSASKLTDPNKGSITAFNASGGFTYQAPASIGASFSPSLKKEVVVSDASFYANNFRFVDVNADGYPDLIQLSGEGIGYPRLRAFDLKNNVELWAKDSPADGCSFGLLRDGFSIAVADIDDDGVPDVVLIGRCPPEQNVYAQPDRLLAFNARTGALKWSSPIMTDPAFSTAGLSIENGNLLNTSRGSIPNIVRLRAGEKPSIVLGVATGSFTYRNANLPNQTAFPACRALVSSVPDGTYRPGVGTQNDEGVSHYENCVGAIVFDGQTGAITRRTIANAGSQGGVLSGNPNDFGYLTGVVVADLANTGENKIAMSGAVWNVDGTRYGNAQPIQVSAMALGNFDNEPDIEMVTIEFPPSRQPQLTVKKHDGRVLWTLPLPYSWSGHLTVSDIDGDGKPDILFWTLSNQPELWAVDHRGRMKWIYKAAPTTNDSPVTVLARVAAYDLDGDGVAEIIFPERDKLRFLNGSDGREKAAIATKAVPQPNGSYSWYPTPSVLDVDNDGKADVVLFSAGFMNVCCSANAVTSLMIFSDAANNWRPARKVDNQWAYFGANINDDGTVPATAPIPNAFRTPMTNVWGTQPQIAPLIDPRGIQQTSFTYAASNGALTSASATATIKLLPTNRPPRFTSEPPTRYLANAAMTYTAQAVDPDAGDTVTYAIVSQAGNNGGCTIGAATGALSCPAENRQYMVIISATDGFGAVTLQTLNLIAAAGAAAVPNVVGQTQTAAGTALSAATFAVGEITESNSVRPIGEVLTQLPAAGASALQGEAVSLVISKGPAPTPVPLLVGRSQLQANNALGAAGFTPQSTQQYSNTVARGTVISQSPSAGTSLTPIATTPVSMVISAGSGLDVQLPATVSPAGGSLAFNVLAFDLSGNSTPATGATFSVHSVGTTVGATPTVSGNTISIPATSRGTFAIVGSRAGATAQAQFVVIPPDALAGEGLAAQWKQFSTVIEGLAAIAEQLERARSADDGPQLRSLFKQSLALWKTLRLDRQRVASPLLTERGWPLDLPGMVAKGYSQSTDDVLLKQKLEDISQTLETLNDDFVGGTTLARLKANAIAVDAAADGLAALAPTPYGVIDSGEDYAAILNSRLPAVLNNWFVWLENYLNKTETLPATIGRAGSEYAKFQASTYLQIADLSSSLISTGIELKDSAKELAAGANPLLFMAKKLYAPALSQLGTSAAIISFAQHTRAAFGAIKLEEVIAGSALALKRSGQPLTAIEGLGIFWRKPDANSVMVVGPDQLGGIKDALAGVSKALEALKQSVTLADPGALFSAYKDWIDVVPKWGEVNAAVSGYKDPLFQVPDFGAQGCLFSADPKCAQLIFSDGLASVYTCEIGKICVPSAVLFVISNPFTGQMIIDTRNFLGQK